MATTTVAIGGVTVSTSGALTGALFQKFNSVTAAAAANSLLNVASPTGTTFPAPISGDTNVLVINSSVTGSISVPAGYQYIVYNGSGSITGGDSSQAVIGDLNYSGGAGTVAASPTVSSEAESVNDSAAGAVLSFANGTNTVTAAGAGQTINLDAGASFVLAQQAGDLINQTGGSSTINSAASTAGSDTVMLTGGTMQFNAFGQGNDVVSVGGNASLMVFGGTTGTDSVFGGSGADTVVVNSGVYTGGSGKSLFVGGAGSSTVYTAAADTMFGGSGSGMYNFTKGSENLWVGGGGKDVVSLASGTVGAQLFGANNEALTLTGAASSSGAVVVALGATESINMMGTAGGNDVILWNAIAGGQTFAGNVTLTASSAGKDLFAMFAASTFGAQSVGPHTITIDNWQASDTFDISNGYTAAQASEATAALASGSSFTLSDGTTVQFNGAKPTTIIHS
jgi:hypothetical protein